MERLAALVAFGFLLGLRHATDADHVVAVSTIVSRQRSVAGALRIGALWGIGHTATILLVGGGVILLNLVITPHLGLAMELAVALMLVVLGLLNLTDKGSSGARPVAWPFYVGLMHGLAGSAAVALLVLTTVSDPTWAMAYLLVFCAGTIAGMMLITVALARSIGYVVSRLAAVNRGLQMAAGALSLALGLVLAYQIGFSDGLFSAHPQWTPR